MTPRRRYAGVGLIAGAALLGIWAVADRAAALGRVLPAMVAALPALVELLTAAIGLLLVVLHWPGRVGRGQYCARCGYYQEDRGRLVPTCPECNQPWLWIGRALRGRPMGSRSLVALGLALVVLAMIGHIFESAASWLYVRLLPQRVLLAQVTALPDDQAGEFWVELARRRLSAAVLDALAPKLIQKKARDGYLSRPGEMVLFSAMMRPGAPVPLTSGYFASFLSAISHVAPTATEGEAMAYESVATFRGHALTLGAVPRVLVISALYTDGSPNPIATWTWDVEPERPDQQLRSMDHDWEAPAPRTINLRQEFWLVFGPPNADAVTWTGGQPAIPAGMAIKDHFTQVQAVTILPRLTKDSVPPG
jgi:hypothetical protein